MFIKVYRYSEVFQLSFCCFLGNKCFERSLCFFYLYNYDTILIKELQNKAMVYYTC